MEPFAPEGRSWLALAELRMRGAGLKAGAARTAVVDFLAREGLCLLSAQEITERLRDQSQVGSGASVYRALEQLHELGLVHRLDGQDGVARYEIALPDRHHHHFIDEETGAVIAFEDTNLEAAISGIAKRLGVTLRSHDVILRGTASPARQDH